MGADLLSLFLNLVYDLLSLFLNLVYDITFSKPGVWLIITFSKPGVWLITFSKPGVWLIITFSKPGVWLIITISKQGVWLITFFKLVYALSSYFLNPVYDLLSHFLNLLYDLLSVWCYRLQVNNAYWGHIALFCWPRQNPVRRFLLRRSYLLANQATQTANDSCLKGQSHYRIYFVVQICYFQYFKNLYILHSKWQINACHTEIIKH